MQFDAFNLSINITEIGQLTLPLMFIIGGLILGIIVERIIVARVKRLAERTDEQIDDIIIGPLHRMPVLWFTLGGIYLSALRLFGPNLLTIIRPILLIIFVLSITIVLARIAVGFVQLYTKRKGLPSISIFTTITAILFFIVGILVILQTLGISIAPILTTLGVGGLAVALALQDTLSNLFAGFQIIISEKLKPGDFIKLDTGEEGYVVDIAWRNTTVRQLANNMVVIPNAKLGAANVTNYYQPSRDLAVLIDIGVSYGSDLRHVERVTIAVGKEVMREVQGGVPEFEPFIRYNQFDDFSINFTVILRGQEFTDQFLIKHEFMIRLHERYNAEGIEIPFPIRTIHMKDSSCNGREPEHHAV